MNDQNTTHSVINLILKKMKKAVFTFLIFILGGHFLFSQNPCSISQFSYSLEYEADNQYYVNIYNLQEKVSEYTVTINEENWAEPSKIFNDSYWYGPFEANCQYPLSIGLELIEDPLCNLQVNGGHPCPKELGCGFSDFTHEVTCADSVFITLNFDALNVESDHFFITDDKNINYGLFAYSDLPVTFPYNPDDTGIASFQVIDSIENPSCVGGYSFVVGCNTDECHINNMTYSFSECHPDTGVYMTVYFDHYNTSDSFTLQRNEAILGTFSYADMPVTVGPLSTNCGAVETIGVQDSTFPNCVLYDEVSICCTTLCNEPIFEVVNFECQEQGFDLKLQIEQNDEEYNVPNFIYLNGVALDTFNVQLPYIYISGSKELIKPYNYITACNYTGNGTECCFNGEFEADDCLPNECAIYGIEYSYPEFCQSDSGVMVTIDFQYGAQNSDSFYLTLIEDYGEFAYADLPVTIGPVQDFCEVSTEIEIRDSENSDCIGIRQGVSICCDTQCHESDFEIIYIECDSNSLLAKLELSQNSYYNNYSIQLNGEPVEIVEEDFPFVYVKSPIHVIALPPYFTLCQVGFAGEYCCVNKPFELDCYNEECYISDIKAKMSDCIDTDLPSFTIDFEYSNVGKEGFSVKGNGNNYGTFQYSDLPIQIEVKDDCITNYEFIITDNEKPNCSNFVEAGVYCCDQNCSFRINDLYLSCDNGILDSISFFLEEDTDPLKEYQIYINEELIYETGENNTTIDIETNLPLWTNGEYVLTICDGDCCIREELDLSDCVPTEPCSIDGIDILEVECEDGSLTFLLDVEYTNVNSDEFDVYTLFGYFGTYSYADLPVKVEGFPGTIIGKGLLFVCDDDSFCCNGQAFDHPICPPLQSIDIADEEKTEDTGDDQQFIKQNPVTHTLTLVSQSEKTKYQIFNNRGTLVQTVIADSLETVVDVSGIESGMYFVRINTEAGIKTEKLIINK